MGTHRVSGERVLNTLQDLILRCVAVLSANSNHVEEDLLSLPATGGTGTSRGLAAGWVLQP